MYTLGDIPRKSAILYSDYTATVFEGVRLTYRQLNNRVNRLANALDGLGIGPQDRLCVLAENTHKYLEIYFAASKLGISVTPLNFRLADPEIVHIVNDAEATCLFAGDGYEDRASGIKGDLQNIKCWISMDNPVEDFEEYEKLLESASDQEPGRDAAEEDMAILMYTGGNHGPSQRGDDFPSGHYDRSRFRGPGICFFAQGCHLFYFAFVPCVHVAGAGGAPCGRQGGH